MKGFKFEMEQILRMKRWKEEEAKKALAVEVQQLEKLKQKLLELQAERNSIFGPEQSAEDEILNVSERLGILQYAQYMGSLIDGQRGEIASQGVRLKEKTDLLLKAMQERKVLEKLKERKLQEFKVQRNRFQYANLDESSAGFLRRFANEQIETSTQPEK